VTGSGDYIPRNPLANGANFSHLKREYSHSIRTQRSPQSHDRTQWANERGSVISSEADVVAFTLSPRAARCPTPHVRTMNCPPVHRYRFVLVLWLTRRLWPENLRPTVRCITIHTARNHQSDSGAFSRDESDGFIGQAWKSLSERLRRCRQQMLW